MNHGKVNAEEAADLTPKYSVRVLEPGDFASWDSFVRQSPQGTLFHTTKWLRSTGTPFHIYGSYYHDTLVGGMVVEIVARQAAGHSFFTTSTGESEAADRAVGHAFSCPYLGVVLPPPGKKYITTLRQHRNITTSLATYVRDQFASVDSRMGPDVVDMEPFVSAGYWISLRYTFRIDLSDLATVWSNMTDKRRNDIRKAERDGFTIDSQGSMQDMASLYRGTFQRKGRAARFSELADRRDQMLRADNQCHCFIARDRSGKAVAGIYMVWDEKCAYYLYGGYGVTAAHRGAGALAIWEAIRYAGGVLGLQRFDLLGGGLGPIEQFMRDFGGRLTVTFVVHYERPSFSRDVRRALQRLRAIMTSEKK
jgi:Acetyltransferase (GNAT) domain